jgi:hypothetical protein
MSAEFYAGHSFDWIQKFLDSIPEKRWFHKNIVFCIACCIHHQYVYKRQSTFKLTHKKLASFGVNRKNLKRYLEVFQQAGLIKYKIELKKSPVITLLSLPNNKQVRSNKSINIYHPYVQKSTTPCKKKDMLQVQKKTCFKINKKRSKEQREEPSGESSKEPNKESVKEPRNEPSDQARKIVQKSKNFTGTGWWYSPYFKEISEQIDKELKRVQNKKKIVKK